MSSFETHAKNLIAKNKVECFQLVFNNLLTSLGQHAKLHGLPPAAILKISDEHDSQTLKNRA